MKKRINQPGLITYNNSRSPISEQFRSIRTSIEFSQISKHYNSIVVTSSEPGTGKSTMSSNLAISYAQKGHRTLLIDSDMRKPKIHTIFDVENKRGLSTEFIDSTRRETPYQDSGIENLYLLTSGPVPPAPNELLGSGKLPLLLEKYQQIFETIIIDTPPINIVSDASIWLSKVDGVILVMRSNVTLKKEAKRAADLIEKFEGKLIGGILNGVSAQNKGDYYYGY